MDAWRTTCRASFPSVGFLPNPFPRNSPTYTVLDRVKSQSAVAPRPSRTRPPRQVLGAGPLPRRLSTLGSVFQRTLANA